MQEWVLLFQRLEINLILVASELFLAFNFNTRIFLIVRS